MAIVIPGHIFHAATGPPGDGLVVIHHATNFSAGFTDRIVANGASVGAYEVVIHADVVTTLVGSYLKIV